MDVVVLARVVDVVTAFTGLTGGKDWVFSFLIVPDEGAVALFDGGARCALDVVFKDFLDGLLPWELFIGYAGPFRAVEVAHEAATFGNEANAGDAVKETLEFFGGSGAHDVYYILVV